MTFKQFQQWCNDRACDGCWGYNEALICIHAVRDVRQHPFWKREKVWQKYHKDFVVGRIVEPINRMIQERKEKWLN